MNGHIDRWMSRQTIRHTHRQTGQSIDEWHNKSVFQKGAEHRVLESLDLVSVNKTSLGMILSQGAEGYSLPYQAAMC